VILPPLVFHGAVYVFYVDVYGCEAISMSTLSVKATGNTKGGSITVPLTSCLTGLELAV
jgi:hypothetical protein